MSDVTKIRKGEELPIEDLSDHLVTKLGDEFETIKLKQFPGGASNLTYELTTPVRKYVLRRPPFGNQVKTAHDMKREYVVLSALQGHYEAAPEPIYFCEDVGVTGSEFYLMERVEGLVIRNEWPFRTDETSYKKSVNSVVAILSELHRLDWKSIGLENFGKPEGYVERQVRGWSDRYFKVKTEEWPDLERAIVWLNENIPDDDDSSLVHNDFKYDNIVFEEGSSEKIVAVLDWEMATIGSPLMDLGTTLGYWMSKEVGEELLSMPFNPRVLMEYVDRDQIVEMYARHSGRDVANIEYYHVFGTVKIAVIAQQIYYRFAKGFTEDKRFSIFNKFVGALGGIAARAISS